MDPAPADDAGPSAPDTPVAEPMTTFVEERGRSGKAFVIVMVLVMTAIAILLTLASGSLSGPTADSTGSTTQPITTEP